MRRARIVGAAVAVIAFCGVCLLRRALSPHSSTTVPPPTRVSSGSSTAVPTTDGSSPASTATSVVTGGRHHPRGCRRRRIVSAGLHHWGAGRGEGARAVLWSTVRASAEVGGTAGGHPALGQHHRLGGRRPAAAGQAAAPAVAGCRAYLVVFSDIGTSPNHFNAWEPELSMAADGSLVAHWADESDNRHTTRRSFRPGVSTGCFGLPPRTP